MRRRAAALADAVVSAGAAIGGIALWAVTLIVGYDVIARYLGHPTIWGLEVTTYLLIAIGVTGCGEAFARRAHFSVDILPDLLRWRSRRVLEMSLTVVTVGFAVYFAWGVWQLLEMTHMLGMRSPTVLQVPLVYPQSLLLLGAITLVLAGLRRLLRLWRATDEPAP